MSVSVVLYTRHTWSEFSTPHQGMAGYVFRLPTHRSPSLKEDEVLVPLRTGSLGLEVGAQASTRWAPDNATLSNFSKRSG